MWRSSEAAGKAEDVWSWAGPVVLEEWSRSVEQDAINDHTAWLVLFFWMQLETEWLRKLDKKYWKWSRSDCSIDPAHSDERIWS